MQDVDWSGKGDVQVRRSLPRACRMADRYGGAGALVHAEKLMDTLHFPAMGKRVIRRVSETSRFGPYGW